MVSYRELQRATEMPVHVSCHRHAEAITLLLAVIREAPNLPDAYHTLGLLYESQGDAKKALDFHMISAHLSKVSGLSVTAPAAVITFCCHRQEAGKVHLMTLRLEQCDCLQDSQVWKRIAKMSTDLGYLRQAIYCLKNVRVADHMLIVFSTDTWHFLMQLLYHAMQAINHDKNDLDAKWDKAVLHSEIDEPRKASKAASVKYTVGLHVPVHSFYSGSNILSMSSSTQLLDFTRMLPV